jgi:pimeloyl-ACP methyl ester carboxylesterase
LPSFDSDGVKIAYDVHGEGEPILLIHGFASNAAVNWKSTGWIDLLTKAGRQVITIDNRGHGKSEKLYDARAPTRRGRWQLIPAGCSLTSGCRRLTSWGTRWGRDLTALIGIHHGSQARSLIIAGLAGNMIHGVGGSAEIADALRAESVSKVKDAGAKAFRLFAEQTNSDLEALAACISSHREIVTTEDLDKINVPALVVAGEDDEIAGSVSTLVDAIPGSEGVVLPGRDHMKAVGDKTYKLSVLDFLDRRP